MDDLKEDISFNKALLITIPMVVCSCYAFHLYFYRHAFEPLALKIFGGIGAVIAVYYLIKVLKLRKKRQLLQLRYEGAMAVGQELDQLKLEGDHVCHDFPADNFNIDHLVVGRKGIFTVVTNARSRPINGDRRRDVTVGEVKHFARIRLAARSFDCYLVWQRCASCFANRRLSTCSASLRRKR